MSEIEFDPGVLQAYTTESQEHLDRASADLLELEASGGSADPERVAEIFRAIHSVKGGAGFLGLTGVTELAHAMENVLNLVRHGKLELNGERTSALLRGIDALTEMLADPTNGHDRDDTDCLAALQAIADGKDKATPGAPEPPAGKESGAAAVVLRTTAAEAAQALRTMNHLYQVEYRLVEDLRERGLSPAAVLGELSETGKVLESQETDASLHVLFATTIDPEVITALIEVDPGQIRELTPADLAAGPAEAGAAKRNGRGGNEPEATTELEEDVGSPRAIPAAAIPPDRETPPDPPAPASAEPLPPIKASPAKGQEESSLRVDVGLLDRLMNLAGELVLTRNRLVQVVGLGDLEATQAATQGLDQVTTELQEAVVSTRMQSVGHVFQRFRRMVRDLGREMGKEVELTIQGEEVDLDKAIIEALGDPLVHLVRNAMDHGIESPDERRRLGKRLPASLSIRAFQETGQAIIEIADDGRGIDPQKVREKALATGELDPAEVRVMSDRELLKLIFRAGFSTAARITDISGRGVGMDVVHTNITRLGGVIDLDTQVGSGTTVRIKLPLTLAIIPSLLVAVDREYFAVPQANLVELVRVPADQVPQRLQRLGSAQVLRLRDRLLPLVHLREVLGQESPAQAENSHYVLVVKTGDFQYGLVVDELLDSREIVVKSLDHHLSDCRVYAGGTVLGDGQVALILDVAGIREAMELEEVAPAEAESADSLPLAGDEQLLLLVRHGAEELFAVPVNLISRIEHIERGQIQQAGGRAVMQYRQRHLVLFTVDQGARVSPRVETEDPYVVVFRIAGREAGLLVSAVIDIALDRVEIDSEGFRQPGIHGVAIVGGRTVLVVDLYGLVRAVEPDWLDRPRAKPHQEVTILVAEDMPFFRQQFRKILEEAGYRTVVTEDGAAALHELETRGEGIDLLVTDVEMPRLDGLELTRRVRADGRWTRLPVIAVTSLSSSEDEKRGRTAGVDEYLIKLDQEQLLAAVHRYVEQGRQG